MDGRTGKVPDRVQGVRLRALLTSLLVGLASTASAQTDTSADTYQADESLQQSEIIDVPPAMPNLGMPDFESIAVASHPRIAEAIARVRAARGNADRSIAASRCKNPFRASIRRWWSARVTDGSRSLKR